MKGFQKRIITNVMSWFLVFFLFYSAPLLPSAGHREDQLEGLFQWTTFDYQNGRYREVIRNLELLLSYFDEPGDKRENKKRDRLRGKIYLLLGAANEQLGRSQKAKENYRLSKEILENQNTAMKIEGIDFIYLKEYQRIIKDKKACPGKTGNN